MQNNDRYGRYCIYRFLIEEKNEAAAAFFGSRGFYCSCYFLRNKIFESVQCLHQCFGRSVPFIIGYGAEYHRDHFSSGTVKRYDDTIPSGGCAAGFQTGNRRMIKRIVRIQHSVGVIPRHAFSVGEIYLDPVFPSNLSDCRKTERRFREHKQVLRRGVLSVCVITVGIQKSAAPHAELCRRLIHHLHKTLHGGLI